MRGKIRVGDKIRERGDEAGKQRERKNRGIRAEEEEREERSFNGNLGKQEAKSEEGKVRTQLGIKEIDI